MKTVKLMSITDVKTEKQRTDGKKSRQYYVAEFGNPSNPFAPSVKRTFFQAHNADGSTTWKGANPSTVSAAIGKEIPGSIINMKVEKYPVLLADGTQQKRKDGSLVFADNVTIVCFEGENAEAIVRANGKTPINAQTTVSVSTESALLV